MIELIPGLPDRIVGFRASGHVTAADYETVLMPAIDAAIARHGSIRMLYHVGPGFAGFTAGAMWDDAKVGIAHMRAFERVAVVTDVEWIAGAVRLFRFAMPAAVRVFPNAQYAEAAAWIAA
ncbi:MAG: STAS/SEC14 domain-containing protein [Vicinamibacterales bacterium]